MANYAWVEVIIITFLYAVLTVRVLTASNNDMKLVETRTVHFARIKVKKPIVLRAQTKQRTRY